jgi:predicted dithiol-disulfide oxidoreductase (DUF899 family)
MTYAATRERLNDYRAKISALREEMRKEQAAVEPEVVKDYVFQTLTGDVRLSQLFGDKRDLFVIHNMGTTCPACTMWADGYNGFLQHISARAAFVVASPDAPSVQRDFAADRGWRFAMVSAKNNTFNADMGYSAPTHPVLPGISVFRKDGDRILRVSDTDLGPRDDFSPVWHLLDMLPEGSDDFRPRFHYFTARERDASTKS